jgi:hypothetical protein
MLQVCEELANLQLKGSRFRPLYDTDRIPALKS